MDAEDLRGDETQMKRDMPQRFHDRWQPPQGVRVTKKRDMPQHRASVLGTKRILLFKEMLLHFGYGDPAIADCMKEGFDLHHVRATAAQTRTGIIH